MRFRVVVLVPSSESFGGVAHYYQKIRKYLPDDIRYFVRGVRNQHSKLSHILYSILLVYDYLHFVWILITQKIKLVHVNTSFGITGLIRDSIFILISKLTKKKIVVFFRGIDDRIISRLTKDRFLLNLFKISFLKSDEIWLFSKHLERQLREWGYKGLIRHETTIVDTSLLKDLTLDTIQVKYAFKGGPFKILFLSRIEREKGLFETIDAFRIFTKYHHNAVLNICGTGGCVKEMLRYIGSDINKSIFYKGFVAGQEKAKMFSESHLFVFPSYGEGMPNVLMEAMAFGLPILTSNVGGILDFFEDTQMGFFIDSHDPDIIAREMNMVLTNLDNCKRIGLYNYNFAKQNLYDRVVAERLEKYYNYILSSD